MTTGRSGSVRFADVVDRPVRYNDFGCLVDTECFLDGREVTCELGYVMCGGALNRVSREGEGASCSDP